MEMRSRTIRRLLPVSSFDCAGLEAWFADMAGQGLFVTKTGYYFANFQRREARNLAYSLEPCDQYGDEYMQEVTGQYRLAGWEAAGDVWKKFLIFSAEKDVAIKPELSEDFRKAGDCSLKRTGYGCLMTSALDGVLAVLWCWIIFGRNGFWYALTRVTPFVLCLLMVFMFSMNILWRMSDYFQIQRYLRRVSVRRGSKKAGKGRKRSVCLSIITVCLSIVFLWGQEQNSWHLELGEADTKLPVPPITALSDENKLTSGIVDYHSSLLVPVQYEIRQEGVDAQELRIDYMELRFPRMVKTTLHGLMSEKMSWSDTEQEEMQTDLFDTAYQAEINENMHYFFASEGRTVIAVCYIGTGYSEDSLKKIRDAMVTWTEPETFKSLLAQ